MKKKKKESLMLGRLLERIAPSIGATVLLEPEWKVVGRITFKNGEHSYFRYNTLDLNPVGSSDIAKDKDYANFFMKELGYPVVPGSKTFFSEEWAKVVGRSRRGIDTAYRHAKKLGFPVVVKPNSGSQGVGVNVVHTKSDFYKVVREIFKRDRIVLVQEPVQGTDYRLVVLDDKVISAYERIPLKVVGDGKSTIRQLLTIKGNLFKKEGRDTNLKLDDPRIKRKLSRQKLSFRSVPNKGQMVYLLDNANLSSGGDAVDVTHKVHPDFAKIAVRLTREMGLRLCGVDLMVAGSVSEPAGEYWVLEINAAPGLDHYAKGGKEQEKVVEQLYLEVLKHLEK